MPSLRTMASMLARELVFRLACRHRQGTKPNILLHCTRRGGSTWLLNTIAAHPGMRYVGRPLLSVQDSRWHRRLPDLAHAARYEGAHAFRQVIGFRPEQEAEFLALVRDIVGAKLALYPSLNFNAPYFHRVTQRVVFQMTSGQPLIEWLDANLDVATVVLFRHPIPTALSVMREGWSDDCQDFLLHRDFVDEHLDAAQYARAQRIVGSGSVLERHVLDWTLHMLVAARSLQAGRGGDWLSLTYEQIVRDPDAVVDQLSEHLDLPDNGAMRAQVDRPSRTVTAATASRRDNADYVLDRWRERVDDDEAARLLEIPRSFGIEQY